MKEKNQPILHQKRRANRPQKIHDAETPILVLEEGYSQEAGFPNENVWHGSGGFREVYMNSYEIDLRPLSVGCF